MSRQQGFLGHALFQIFKIVCSLHAIEQFEHFWKTFGWVLNLLHFMAITPFFHMSQKKNREKKNFEIWCSHEEMKWLSSVSTENQTVSIDL